MDKILTYISSSELNRCKKNGLNILLPRENWMDVLSYSWLTRKLRRKIGHLFQLDLLPIVYKPLITIATGDEPMFDYLNGQLAKSYMDAEDEEIMKGARQ